jgi:acetyltransferase-like isoleucine patch superfamily enzyme
VHTKHIGEGTLVWQFVVILKGAVIGKGCNINCNTFIENDVVVGDNVTIKCGTNLWDSVRIEDDVFLGPSVVFSSDHRPIGQRQSPYPLTVVKKGASLGSGTTVLPGIQIGRYAMTGAGSVVTENVADYALVYGNPAKRHAWIDESGKKLVHKGDGIWMAEDGSLFKETGNTISKVGNGG